MPRFSIITPFHIWSEERERYFYRCIESVRALTNTDFEWVLVDDGSVLPYQEPKDPFVRLFTQPHYERVISYNKAFKEATGDWFVLLDSDDEILPNALDTYSDAIFAWPYFKMFNFATKFASKEGPEKDWVRGPFEPPMKDVGHEKFGGGNIVNGSFIWHRSVYDELGGFPEACYNRRHRMHLGKNLMMTNPWDFSIRMQELYPEIKPMFSSVSEDHPKGYPKELGNPWGQDFALFYKYTRKVHTLAVDTATHVIHPR